MTSLVVEKIDRFVKSMDRFVRVASFITPVTKIEILRVFFWGLCPANVWLLIVMGFQDMIDGQRKLGCRPYMGVACNQASRCVMTHHSWHSACFRPMGSTKDTIWYISDKTCRCACKMCRPCRLYFND